MNDNANQTVDLAAVSTQIDILKSQRNTANDDVAVLLGQLDSLKQRYALLEKDNEVLRSEITRNKAESGTQDTEGQQKMGA